MSTSPQLWFLSISSPEVLFITSAQVMRELAGRVVLPLAAEDQTPVLLARAGIDFSMRPGQLGYGVMRLQLGGHGTNRVGGGGQTKRRITRCTFLRE